MTPQAQLALLLSVPLILYFFQRFPKERAVVISFIFSFLFLPERAQFALPLFPDFDKITAPSYTILLATCLYYPQTFKTFKLGWLDIPMVMWAISPAISSITNSLSLYDGLSLILDQIGKYVIPFFLARIYLNNLKGLRELAIGIFVGGVIYAPLCFLENLISPQLHRMVYGYHAIVSFDQSYRLGGYRPNVFLIHGLSVGMWMMAALLTSLWLWQAGTLKKFLNIPMNLWFIGLYVIHLLARSTGAYLYMFYGLIIFFCAKFLRTAFPKLLLILLLSSYLYLAATGNFTGKQADQIVEIAAQFTGKERAASLEFRFNNEELLVKKAMERMWFGWAGWGRNRVYAYDKWADKVVDISTTDSLWIIAYGVNGVFGLFGIFGASLLPALTFSLFRYPPKTWFLPQVGGAACLNAVIILSVLDNLLNDQYNPVFMMISGGLAGLLMNPNPQESNPSVLVSTNPINHDSTLNPKIPAQPLPNVRAVDPILKVNSRKSRPIPRFAKTVNPILKMNGRKPQSVPKSAKTIHPILKMNRRKSRPIPISAKPSYSSLRLNRKNSRSQGSIE